MTKTEAEIAEALRAHFYTIRQTYYGHHVVDTLERQVPKRQPIRLWTDDDLRQLWEMKRDGLTMDAIEVDLGRDRRQICQMWARRKDWKNRVSLRRNGPPTLEELRRVVCTNFGVAKDEFTSPSRATAICGARQVFYWIARTYTLRSTTIIGQFAGGRDHSTVLHGIEKVRKKFHLFRAKIELCLFDLGLDLAQQQEAA